MISVIGPVSDRAGQWSGRSVIGPVSDRAGQWSGRSVIGPVSDRAGQWSGRSVIGPVSDRAGQWSSRSVIGPVSDRAGQWSGRSVSASALSSDVKAAVHGWSTGPSDSLETVRFTCNRPLLCRVSVGASQSSSILTYRYAVTSEVHEFDSLANRQPMKVEHSWCYLISPVIWSRRVPQSAVYAAVYWANLSGLK